MGKRTTSQLTSINIKTLDATTKAYGSATFRYMVEGKQMKHDVRITQTACNYGGVRYWFQCEYCRGRVCVLYISGGQCACRKCFNLAYQSERDTWQNQQYRKADNIRDRLGWAAGIANGDGVKPKGMHWKTFYKIKSEYDYRLQRIFVSTAEWCDKIRAELNL
ncbi:MAG: hypothetical protein WCP01_10405 [Methylococcaceae bacterium]